MEHLVEDVLNKLGITHEQFEPDVRNLSLELLANKNAESVAMLLALAIANSEATGQLNSMLLAKQVEQEMAITELKTQIEVLGGSANA